MRLAGAPTYGAQIGFTLLLSNSKFKKTWPKNAFLRNSGLLFAPSPAPDTRCARVRGRELFTDNVFWLASGSSPRKAAAEAEGGWVGGLQATPNLKLLHCYLSQFFIPPKSGIIPS